MNALVTITTEQTYHQIAKARHVRLWGKPKVVNIIVAKRLADEAARLERARAEYRPRDESEKDSHVKVWKRWNAGKHKSIRGYIFARSHELGVDPEAIIRQDRRSFLAGPRRQMMWEVKQHFPSASSVQVGRAFCRDHTTVLSNWNRYEELLKEGEI